MDPRYPIGQYNAPKEVTAAMRAQAIQEIRAAPAAVRAATEGLSDAQLDTPYREGGWTVRQVVHHLADSHLNAYARLRLALTEDWPPIKTYPPAGSCCSKASPPPTGNAATTTPKAAARTSTRWSPFTTGTPATISPR